MLLELQGLAEMNALLQEIVKDADVHVHSARVLL